MVYLTSRFYEKVDKEHALRIPKASLEIIYQKYWKNEREKRKRSFLRIFWEKADFDDVDPLSAFRKR
jgi:truncated hemoglobin YjbI